jgi:hypothetical protein
MNIKLQNLIESTYGDRLPNDRSPTKEYDIQLDQEIMAELQSSFTNFMKRHGKKMMSEERMDFLQESKKLSDFMWHFIERE